MKINISEQINTMSKLISAMQHSVTYEPYNRDSANQLRDLLARTDDCIACIRAQMLADALDYYLPDKKVKE